MRAAVLTATRQVEIQELPVPIPGPGEVLIRVKVAGICGAELHAYIGTHPFRKPPVQMGHEMSGNVAKLGAGVKKNISVGDLVSVLPPRPCGHCPTCMEGLHNLCENKTNLGTSQWPGCFAEYITAPEDSVFKIPPHVTYEEAAIVEPLSVAVHAVRRIGTVLGGSVAILGVGTIGLACVAAAREAGAVRIAATDVADFNLAIARSYGASITINALREDPVASILQFTEGRGVDAVLIAAGFSSVLNQAIDMVRLRGNIVNVALFDDSVSIKNPVSLIAGEKILTSSWASTAQDFQIAIALIATGRIKVQDFITHRLPLERTKQGLEILEERCQDCIKVLLRID